MKKLTLLGQVALAMFPVVASHSSRIGKKSIYEDEADALDLAEHFLNFQGVQEEAVDSSTFANIAQSLLRGMDKQSCKTDKEIEQLEAMIEETLGRG